MNMSTKIWDLPEECLQHILLFTSPEDIFRSAAVSKLFYSVVFSDTNYLWKKLLPSDCDQIIGEAEFNTRNLKDLFVLLYRSHLLIDHDRKSFSLDKNSRKKCYMLGSRSMSIVWGDTPQYWRWISVPESRFAENAELLAVCWLAMDGEIPMKWLSPNTTYGAYFVFKLTQRCSAIEHLPMYVWISKRDIIADGDHPPVVEKKAVYLNPQEGLSEDIPGPEKRKDGWMEIEIGKYEVDGDDYARDGVSLVSAVEQFQNPHWKRGLLVQGIELPPLD